jgi:hypothetical protein
MNKCDYFKWILISVYGPAQDENKSTFLQCLVQSCTEETLPIIVVGGDFNIMKSPKEKNNSRFDDRWPFLFNAVINNLNLR